MRFGGRRSSDNVEFREGGGSRFGFGGGGGGGGAGIIRVDGALEALPGATIVPPIGG